MTFLGTAYDETVGTLIATQLFATEEEGAQGVEIRCLDDYAFLYIADSSADANADDCRLRLTGRPTIALVGDPTAIYIAVSTSCRVIARQCTFEQIDLLNTIQAKTDLIFTGNVTVSNPVAEDSEVTIYAGDDYTDDNDNALSWTSADWPNLTGATLTFHIACDNPLWTPVGSVVTAGLNTQEIKFEMTAEDTNCLRHNTAYSYRISATIDGLTTTLVASTFTVLP